MKSKDLSKYRQEMNDALDLYIKHPSPFLKDKANKAAAAYRKKLSSTSAAANTKKPTGSASLFETANQ